MMQNRRLRFKVWWDADRNRVRARFVPGGRRFPLTRTGDPEHIYRLPAVTGIYTWLRPHPNTYGWGPHGKVTLWIPGYDPAPLFDAIKQVTETGGTVTVTCPWRDRPGESE